MTRNFRLIDYDGQELCRFYTDNRDDDEPVTALLWPEDGSDIEIDLQMVQR